MKRKYNLPDVGKALRIVLMYAKEDGKSKLPAVLAGRNAAVEASGRKQEMLEARTLPVSRADMLLVSVPAATRCTCCASECC